MREFLEHGAAQCGICTPGMLGAATALLERTQSPSETEVMDAIGGVLCRCTGYRKIINMRRDPSTSSSVTSFWNWAKGLRAPWRWFFTETRA